MHYQSPENVFVFPFDVQLIDKSKDLPVIMQFAELHDSNNKEIYEGDIVKFGWNSEQGELGTVVFGKYVTNNEENEDMLGWCVETKERFFAFDPQNSYEVIGNIYQNPELLDAKN